MSDYVDLEKRRATNKRYRDRWYNETGIKQFHTVQRNRPREAEAARRLAEIPPDTRTPSQALLGDPIPNDPRRRRDG